jgi:hypothetical protein
VTTASMQSVTTAGTQCGVRSFICLHDSVWDELSAWCLGSPDMGRIGHKPQSYSRLLGWARGPKGRRKKDGSE